MFCRASADAPGQTQGKTGYRDEPQGGNSSGHDQCIADYGKNLLNKHLKNVWSEITIRP